jgi:hypothetical protein
MATQPAPALWLQSSYICWPCCAVAAAALQAWLEAAWQAGFDPGGAAMLGAAVQCTRKWIGTTEAAAMLRYFGCRALIVDFYGGWLDRWV